MYHRLCYNHNKLVYDTISKVAGLVLLLLIFRELFCMFIKQHRMFREIRGLRLILESIGAKLEKSLECDILQ